VSDELKVGGTTFRFNVYSEQDHRNQPLQQDLDDEEKQSLADAGDDPLAAVVPGADSVAFSNDQVLYARIDSLGYFPVYLYSTSADSAFYRVTFTNVGTGNGDYVQQSFTPNGRVFQWVAPDTVSGTIVHRGDHAPVRVLVAPTTQQMIALGVDHRFGPNTSVTTELALSNADRNTFSSVDDDDNTGYAARAGALHAIPLSRTDTLWKLVLGAEAEALTKEFTVVGPLPARGVRAELERAERCARQRSIAGRSEPGCRGWKEGLGEGARLHLPGARPVRRLATGAGR
jgi:hypothetical protein